MKIHQQKHRLQVTDSDLSGSVYDDVNLSGSSYENVNMSGGTYHNVNLSGCTFDDLNMSGWRVHHVNLSGLKIDRANLAGASIVNSRLDGMTIAADNTLQPGVVSDLVSPDAYSVRMAGIGPGVIYLTGIAPRPSGRKIRSRSSQASGRPVTRSRISASTR